MARAPWGGKIGKQAVLSVARKIAARDGLSWRSALRKALNWAWGRAHVAPVDRYAEMRARGIYSPRDNSADALAHSKEFKRKYGYRPGAQKAGQ